MHTSKELLQSLKAKYPEIQNGQFRVKAVAYMKTKLPAADWALMEEDAEELLTGVPDAFAFHDDGVAIFEIEVHHPAYKRANRVLDMFSFFDEWQIDTQILTVDAYGRIAPLSPLKLLQHRMRLSA